MISFQVLSTSKTLVRVLAVAIPRDVLSEYESVVREAGYEPGAVVPSTLATVASTEADPALIVNANAQGVTAAIVRGGVLLLHRSVDFHVAGPVATPDVPAQLSEPDVLLPLVDVEETAGEWAAQEPLPEHGRNPYAEQQREPGDLAYSPYAQPNVLADLTAELHNSIVIAPTSMASLTDENVAAQIAAAALHVESQPYAPPIVLDEEIAQAVSVFVAYYEDTLGAVPDGILAAGSYGAAEMNRALRDKGVAEGVKAQEIVSSEALGAEGSRIPRGWLAGVVGALRG
jgi:type IV pilus assembly protein PilM